MKWNEMKKMAVAKSAWKHPGNHNMYQFVVTFLRDIATSDLLTKFGLVPKIRSVEREDSLVIWLDSLINWLLPQVEVKE